MKKILLLCFTLILAACEQHKPVESLTYEEKEAITKECQANGKIQTDDYCKQVASVYGDEYVKREQEKNVKNFTKPTEVVKMPY